MATKTTKKTTKKTTGKTIDMSKVEKALVSFCETIEATGGVFMEHDGTTGTTVPVADENWVDLGLAYIDACEALDRTPQYRTPQYTSNPNGDPDDDVEPPDEELNEIENGNES